MAEGRHPISIPNSAVKPSSADGTARATVWESRTLPGFLGAFSLRGRGALFFEGTPFLKGNLACQGAEEFGDEDLVVWADDDPGGGRQGSVRVLVEDQQLPMSDFHEVIEADRCQTFIR